MLKGTHLENSMHSLSGVLAKQGMKRFEFVNLEWLAADVSPSPFLFRLSELNYLRTLHLVISETFSDVQKDCAWLSHLPTSLTDLKLHFVAETEWRQFVGDVSFPRKCKLYRQYSQCLPKLSHLTLLHTLNLCMGGSVSALHLQEISRLPIQHLTFQFRAHVDGGFDDSRAVVQTLSQMTKLSKLTLQIEHCVYSTDYGKRTLCDTLLKANGFHKHGVSTTGTKLCTYNKLGL